MSHEHLTEDFFYHGPTLSEVLADSPALIEYRLKQEANRTPQALLQRLNKQIANLVQMRDRLEKEIKNGHQS